MTRTITVIDAEDNRVPWKRLSTAAVFDAINRLCHEESTRNTLGAWFTLAMSKDKYDAEIDNRLLIDLDPWLINAPDGRLLFSVTGELPNTFTDCAEQEQSELPHEWRVISDDYGKYGKVYYDRIVQKLRTWQLNDYTTDILTYWHDNIDDIRSRRAEYERKTGKEVKGKLGYDVTIAAIRWAQNNFRFEVGDHFDMGAGLSKIRIRDTKLKERLQPDKTIINIADCNLRFWNDNIAKDAFELQIEEYGRMLTERKAKKYTNDAPQPHTDDDAPPETQNYYDNGPTTFYELSDSDGELPF